MPGGNGPRLVLRPGFRLRCGCGLYDTKLTEREGLLLLALAFNGRITEGDLSEVIWPHPDTMPETWSDVLTQVSFRLRRKLEPFGWTIVHRNKWRHLARFNKEA